MVSEQNNDTTQVGLPQGTKIGKYEIRGRLGIGGQAIVYKGYDALLDRMVAIKQIPSHLASDERFLERFRREAQILARLGREGSNIVSVYDVIEDTKGLFLVMEYVEGHTLRTILEHQRYAMPLQPALEILWHIANGLRSAHQQNIIHRDIKPGNVIVTRQYRAKITDFGVAATKGGQESMALGTTKYMAPELFEGGPADARVDIYSLGFIAYEMFTGREFFNENLFADVLRDPASENLRWMKWHSDSDKALPPLSEINLKVPEALSDVIMRMVAKDPDHRYATMDEVMEDLRRAVGGKRRSKRKAIAPAAPMAGGADAPAVEGEDDQDSLALPPEDAEPAEEAPTAEIPTTPEQKRRKLILAGTVAGGVLFVALVALIVMGLMSGSREDQAVALMDQARQQYDQGQYAEAERSFAEVLAEYGDMGLAGAARAGQQLAEAQIAMKQDELDRAEDLANQALETHGWVESRVEAFRQDLGMRRTVLTDLNRVNELASDGQYDEALAELAPLEGVRVRFPNDLVMRISQTRRQIEQARDEADFANYLAEAQSAIEVGDFTTAQQRLDQAKNIRETQALRDLQAELTRRARHSQLIRNAVRAEEAGNLQLAIQDRTAALDLIDTDANRREISRLQAELAYQEGFRAEQDNRLEVALDAYQRGQQLAPDDPRFAEAVARVQDVIERSALIAEARDRMGQREYAEAVDLLLDARDIEAGQDVDDLLAEAEGRMYLIEGDRARRQREWAEAQVAYEQARAANADDARWNQLVDNRLDMVDQERRWYELKAAADRDMEAERYSAAIRSYNSLVDMAAGLSVPVDEVRTSLTEARYRRELARGIDAMDREDYPTAMGYFRLAQDVRDTEEVQDWINRADAAMNPPQE